MNSDCSAMEKLEQMLLSKVEYSRQFSQEFLTEELNNLNYTEFFGEKEKTLFLRKMEEMLIEQGIAEHVITTEVSSKAVVTFFEIIQYYITHNFGSMLQMSKDNLLEELCFLFINGLKNR